MIEETTYITNKSNTTLNHVARQGCWKKNTHKLALKSQENNCNQIPHLTLSELGTVPSYTRLEMHLNPTVRGGAAIRI